MRRPTPTTTSQSFWDAAARGALSYPRCPSCSTWHSYAREWCTNCLYSPLALVPVSGHATVYAATVIHRATQPAFADLVPYAYAVVELDEGIRVVTIVTGCPAAEVTAGMRVDAVIDSDDDGAAAPLIFFTPAGATG
jgi:uncharacterized OB-fold protein